MDFRPDINGLRALAVLAVLAFHFEVPGADRGFVEVDIFFVISAWLMLPTPTFPFRVATESLPDAGFRPGLQGAPQARP